MRFTTLHHVVCVSLAACVSTAGCGGSSGTDAPAYAAAGEAAKAGLVAPLADDNATEIMSWVDGQVVTDWPAEVARRDAAIAAYLNDDDPARAAKYGFRSGQTPRLAWSWFRDNPVGFNGVPYVLLQDDHRSGSQRPQSDAAGHRQDLEA